MVSISQGGSRLDVLLAELKTAIAAMDATAYQQGGQEDVFHEAIIAFTDTDEEADDSSHLAFALVVTDSPVDTFDRQQPGNEIQFLSQVMLTLSWRLRDHNDGNTDGRDVHSALLDICRVLVCCATPGGWTQDETATVEITNRGRLAGRNGSWLRYQVLFTLQHREVL